MAKNELLWQNKIISQVRKEGGFARKWASDYQVGVPDLVVVMDGRTAFVEMKLLDEWPTNTVRTIPYTPKQLECANDIQAAGGLSFGLVVVKTASTDYKLFKTSMPFRAHPVQVRRDQFLAASVNWSWLKTNGLNSWLLGGDLAALVTADT